MEIRVKGPCKVRKRRCSSSSSSSLLRNYRFKRAILGGKRGGSSTPIPAWNMSSKPPLSARKLAATLWEINDVASPPEKEIIEEYGSGKELRKNDRILRSSRFLDPSHIPVSEKKERCRSGRHHRRTSNNSRKFQLVEHSNASLREMEKGPKTGSHVGYIGVTTRLKEVGNCLTSSKQILKVLNHMWDLKEEHHSSTKSLISSLQTELDRTRIHVHQLIKEQEANCLMKTYTEQREKKMRKQSERMNKKLGIELADTKALLSKALRKLEREKTTRKIMEQVCDELARGVGEDRAEVEELKAKLWEEAEERQMLQLADGLREERVQMKLSEAKYQFEEKNAAIEKLRSQLKGYLKSERKQGDQGSFQFEKDRDLVAYLRKNGEKDGDEGGDSSEGDLGSIELNLDNLSKNFKWSYARGFGATDDELKRDSIDVETAKRKSVSDNVQWGSISIGKGIPNETSDRFDGGRLPAHKQNEIKQTNP